MNTGKRFIDSGVGLAKSIKDVKKLLSGGGDPVDSINTYDDFFAQFNNLSESEIKRAAEKLNIKYNAGTQYDNEKRRNANNADNSNNTKAGDSNGFYYEYTPGDRSQPDYEWNEPSGRTYVNLDPDDYKVWESYGELPAPQKRKRGR